MVLKQFPQRIVAFWKLVILLQHGAPLHLLWWLGRSAINEKWKRWWITNQFNITPLLPKWFRESLCLEINFLYSSRGVTFHSLLVTRCKIRSLLVAEVARCKKSLVTCCKKSLVTSCKIRSLRDAEVALCKKSIVTCCEIRSLPVAETHLQLVVNFARYSLQKMAVTKNLSLLVAKFARCQLEKLLVPKNHYLLVAKFACYLLQKLTRHSLQKIIRHSLKQSQVNEVR